MLRLVYAKISLYAKLCLYTKISLYKISLYAKMS